MTLNGVMALTLRYFNKFGKPAFQLITAYSNIEFIDQKSASVMLGFRFTHKHRVAYACAEFYVRVYCTL